MIPKKYLNEINNNLKKYETTQAFLFIKLSNFALNEEKLANAVFKQIGDAFGCEGSLYGIEDENGDYSYGLFIEGLQKYLVDDDAVIILEAGHEKLRYVSGSADIVTKQEIFSLDITSLATQKAREMLCNPDYKTECDY